MKISNALVLVVVLMAGLAASKAQLSQQCSVSIAIGALSSLSEVDYKELKKEFYSCPALLSAVEDIADLDFSFDEGGPTEMRNNLNEVTKVISKVHPAWNSCPSLKAKSETKEEFARVNSVLELFANPSKYDLYKLTVGSVDNWNEVSGQTERALQEIEKGKCARGGFLFGKIMKTVVDSDATLSGLMWNGTSKLFNHTAEKVRGVSAATAGKAKDAAKSAFKAVKGLFGKDEL